MNRFSVGDRVICGPTYISIFGRTGTVVGVVNSIYKYDVQLDDDPHVWLFQEGEIELAGGENGDD